MKELKMKTVKFSSSKTYQKILKCTIYLDIHAITCPGALFTQQESIYLSVCIMGQYKKTRCVPPAFPMLFHQNMVFVRTFPGVVDPADVSEQLASDTTSFELIQMVPPEGEFLATFEECTRDFVFPGPRSTSREEAPEREILMRRGSSFLGIAPKVEFATTSVIEEIDARDSQTATSPCGLLPVKSSPSKSRRSPTKVSPSLNSISRLCSPANSQQPTGGDGNRSLSQSEKEMRTLTTSMLTSASSLPRCPPPPATSASHHLGSQTGRKKRQHFCRGSSPSAISGYQQPTVASTTRALSPYTHRRMCQLSEDARMRLRHLQLGPHRFKKQTESQAPFLVSCCSNVSVTETPSSRHRSTPKSGSPHYYCSASFTADRTDALDSSLLRSYWPKLNKSAPGSRLSGEHVRTVSPMRVAECDHSTPGTSYSKSTLMNNLSLKERFHSVQPAPSCWEQIHSRVQSILHTHSTGHKYLQTEQDEGTVDSCQDALCGAQVQNRKGLGEMGHWTPWRNQASPYDRPQRAVFEESLQEYVQEGHRKLKPMHP